MSLPLLAHQVEGPLGQWNIAIFIAFAAAYMDEPSGAVNIRDPEVSPFLKSEAAGINGGQADPISEHTHMGQYAAHLVGA